MVGRSAIVLTAVLAVGACDPAEREELGESGFYSGRAVEMIVPFGPGGGTDSWARLVARHLQRHLGRRAAIQVVNVPGASSIAGANEFALRRRADGWTLLVSSTTTVLADVLGEPMVRYDFRDMSPIIASPMGGVAFVSPGLGIRSAEDLAGAAGRLRFGGISPTGQDLVMLIAFELLGLDVRTIMGYGSRGATRLAFEQGETNLEYQTMPAYLANVVPLVDEGRAVPLFSFGMLDDGGRVVRDPEVPGLPSVEEVYVDLFGSEPSGPTWEAYRMVLTATVAATKVLWVHSGAPEEAVDALLRAAGSLIADSTFLEAARLELGNYPFYLGAEAERHFRAANEASPETLEWLRNVVVEGYGVERLGSR